MPQHPNKKNLVERGKDRKSHNPAPARKRTAMEMLRERRTKQARGK